MMERMRVAASDLVCPINLKMRAAAHSLERSPRQESAKSHSHRRVQTASGRPVFGGDRSHATRSGS
jgi:hypothetical protein